MDMDDKSCLMSIKHKSMFQTKQGEFGLIQKQKHMQSKPEYKLQNTVHIVHCCCCNAIVITQNTYFLKLKFAKTSTN